MKNKCSLSSLDFYSGENIKIQILKLKKVSNMKIFALKYLYMDELLGIELKT